MSLTFYLSLIFFLFSFIKFTISIDCFGYNPLTQLCLECSLDTYMNQAEISPDQLNPLTDCTIKQTSDLIYNRTYYVSNITCSSCLGTQNNPFDSFISALKQIHSIDQAGKFQQQVIQIYLLGSPHYILNSELLGSNIRFFRRMNASILISPWYCEDGVITGCLMRNNGNNADIIIKTYNFNFEVHRTLTIIGINLIANDISLSALTPKTCYNSKEICCNDTLLAEGFSQEECGLLGKTMNLSSKGQLSKIFGFFTLRVLYNNDTSQPASLLETPLPTLILINTTAKNFFSVNDGSWLNFITFDNLGYNVSFINITFISNFFPFGLIYFSICEEDPYYQYFSKNQLIALYLKYPLSKLYNNSLIINNITISLYNQYNFKISPNYNGTFTMSLINLFNEQNANSCYIFQKIRVSQVNITDPLIFFSYVSMASSNSPLFIFNETTFDDNIALLFISINSSKVICERFLLRNSIYNTGVFIDVMSQSSISLINCSFYNTSFQQYFLLGMNSMVSIINSSFTQIQNFTSMIKQSNLTIKNSILDNITLFNHDQVFILIDSGVYFHDFMINNSYFIASSLGSVFFIKTTIKVYVEICNITMNNSQFNNSYNFIYFLSNEDSSMINMSNFVWSNINYIDDFNTQFSFILVYIEQSTNLDTFLFNSAKFLNIHHFSFIVAASSTVINLVFNDILIDSSNGLNTNMIYFAPSDRFDNWWVFSNIYFINFHTNSLSNFIEINNLFTIFDNFTLVNFDGSFDSLFFSNYINNITIINCMIEISNTSNINTIFYIIPSYMNFINNFLISYRTGPQLMRGVLVTQPTYTVYIIDSIFVNFNSELDTGSNIWNKMGSAVCIGTYTNAMSSAAVLRNNHFINNIGIQYGVVGIYNFYNGGSVEIYNNTFHNSSSSLGGALSLYYDYRVIIKNLTIITAFAMQGGAFYVYSVDIMFVSGLHIVNSQANDGGGIYVENTVNMLYIEDVYMNNTNSSNQGGGISLTACSNVTIIALNIENSFSFTGGSIYVYSSNLTFSNSRIYNSKAEVSGGGIYITGINSVILLKNQVYEKCFAYSSGAAISSSNIYNFTIIDAVFMKNEIDLINKGMGVIELLGFYELGVNNRGFYMRNISFIENIGLAACIYYNSNSKLTLNDSSADKINGSLLFIMSDVSMNLDINGLIITNSNYMTMDRGFINGYLNHPLIHIENTLLNINEMTALNNSNGNFFIEALLASNINIFNSNCSDFKNINPISIIFAFILSISESSLIIDNFIIFNSHEYNNNGLYGFVSLYSASNFSANNSLFYNAITPYSSLFEFKDSSISLFNNTFQQLGASDAIIHCKNSNFTVYHSHFLRDLASDIHFSDDLSTHSSSNFTIFSTLFENIGNSSIIIENIMILMINNCVFESMIENNTLYILSRGIYINDCLNVHIFSTSFNNLYADNGGAMVLLNDNFDHIIRIIIINCSFLNNTASSGGSVFLQGSIDLMINSSIFTNNKAIYNNENLGQGGCLVADCEYYINCEIHINSTKFINNSAENFGATILVKSYNNTIFSTNNDFVGNWDIHNFSQSEVSSPFQLYLFSSDFNINILKNLINITDSKEKTNFLIKNYAVDELIIASGQNFNFSLIFTDSFNNLLSFDNEISASLSCSYIEIDNNTRNNLGIKINRGSATAVNGILSFNEVSMIAFPNYNLSCSITAIYDDTVLFKSSADFIQDTPIRIIDFPIKTAISRKCLIGEIKSDINTCQPCTETSYSLKDPFNSNETIECLPCPENAVCEGGDSIYPIAGSWRASATSSLIMLCPTEEGCLGSMNFSQNYTSLERVQGSCNEDYYGNLCYLCKKGYSRSQENSICQRCSDMVWIYLKIAFGMIFLIFYMYIQAKAYTDYAKENPCLSILIKLFLNHFQILAMISLVNLGWTVDFNTYFSFQEYFSCVYQDFFYIDCLVQNVNEDLFIQKIIFSILLPIIMALIMLVFWLIFSIAEYFKKIPKRWFRIIEKLRISFLAIIYILYPEILRKCFLLMNCILIDDSSKTTVLKLNPNMECWSPMHSKWVLDISLPGLLIWGIFTPLVIFFFLYKIKSDISSMIIDTKSIIRSKKSLQKSKSNMEKRSIIEKHVRIDIDSFIKEKFFKEIELPFEYKTEKQHPNLKVILIENVEICVKEKELILEDLKISVDLTDTLIEAYNIEDEKNKVFKNEDLRVKDPTILSDYLNFMVNLDFSSIKKEDLEVNLVHLRINFTELENIRKNTTRLSLFPTKSMKKKSKKSKNDEENSTIVKNLGFLYRGYEEKYYYWEIVLFSRKFLLIMIGVFTEIFPAETKITNLMLALLCYYSAQIYCKPYNFKYFNKLENTSLLISLVTAYIGILLYSDTIKKASIFFLIMLFVMNAYYIILWGYYVRVYGDIDEKINRIKQILAACVRRCKDMVRTGKDKITYTCKRIKEIIRSFCTKIRSKCK